MKNKPKVTVCIPCYNEQKFIASSLESTLSQTYKDINIYIVDNNSTDNTLEIVTKYKDPRIKIFKNEENIGMFQNMNRCLDLSNTDYVKILCADDTLETDCLDKQVDVLEKNPKVGVVFNSSKIIDAKNKTLFKRKSFKCDTKVSGKELIRKILLSGRNPVGEPSCCLFRTKIIKEGNFQYNPKLPYVGDLDFLIKILSMSSGYYISDTLSSFRIHGKSGSAKIIKRVIGEHKYLIEKYGRMIKLSEFDLASYYVKLFFFYFSKNVAFFVFAR